ncbi:MULTISPECIES: hypothetical protein [Streptomyces]|uniref:hypothetical protein n=1 Tax=Streptomyces TaxID=1883 RepID=UPI0013017C7B|nr:MULTISPECIES: hypothetical protein [unclassified Streptomyces]QNQ32548.1 hypothetical protein HYC88_01865 [Streptomyces sp. CB00271]
MLDARYWSLWITGLPSLSTRTWRPASKRSPGSGRDGTSGWGVPLTFKANGSGGT